MVILWFFLPQQKILPDGEPCKKILSNWDSETAVFHSLTLNPGLKKEERAVLANCTFVCRIIMTQENHPKLTEIENVP